MKTEKNQERQLETTKLITLENPKERAEDLKFLYTQVCTSWRQLVEVRFKLLGLLPAVSLAVIVSLLNAEKMDNTAKAFVCLIGLIFTIALRIYDLRNTSLHDDLISRGRKIEEELVILNGQFLGRLKPKDKKVLGFLKIQHDTALTIIYYTVMAVWLMMGIIWFVKGLCS